MDELVVKPCKCALMREGFTAVAIGKRALRGRRPHVLFVAEQKEAK